MVLIVVCVLSDMTLFDSWEFEILIHWMLVILQKENEQERENREGRPRYKALCKDTFRSQPNESLCLLRLKASQTDLEGLLR